jgi:broad-specificity NMP kinase
MTPKDRAQWRVFDTEKLQENVRREALSIDIMSAEANDQFRQPTGSSVINGTEKKARAAPDEC